MEAYMIMSFIIYKNRGRVHPHEGHLMCMSWADVGEFIKAVAPVFTAGAACTGVYIAYRGLTKWRGETVGKRKIELAEEVLADFYQARDIIKAARSPFGYAHEGLSRQKGEDETEEDTRILNSYFAATERLASKADFFAETWARRYRFTAVFGPEAAKAYDDLFEVRNEIIVSVRSLISAHGHRLSASDQVAKARWENTIWSSAEDDPIPGRLDRVVETIEKTCRPAIRESASDD